MDLNKFYAQYCDNPEMAQLELIKKITGELLSCVRENIYTLPELKDGYPGYVEIREWCNIPPNAGIFDDCIDIARDMAIRIIDSVGAAT